VGVGLPASVEQGDLVSYGVFGLIDAIEKYDPERAIKFETDAINRIRGAIIDELRSFDWIPRSVRTEARDIERAIAVLEARLQRTPTEAEIAPLRVVDPGRDRPGAGGDREPYLPAAHQGDDGQAGTDRRRRRRLI
jgi:RNA polymerase sigma factor (sigma-70 family)